MKLSIITINRNNADGLRRTLASTFDAQPDFDDWEQIVVDGASTDGSVGVLDKWKDNPHLGWHVSEPDKGIYNAMNKGAAHARGDYLLFLNSGDILLPDVLGKSFAGHPTEDILCGDTIGCYPWGESFIRGPEPNEVAPEMFLFPVPHNLFHHQASFISRRLHNEIGGYDESFAICGDANFFFAAVTEKDSTYKHLPFVVDKFDGTGLSSRADSWDARLTERERYLTPYFGETTVKAAMLGRTNAFLVPCELTEFVRKDAEKLQSARRFLKAYASLSQTKRGRWALRLVLYLMERRWRRLLLFRFMHRFFRLFLPG